MANSNFVVHNGITVGPLTIDAATGDMTTTGTISVTGGGSFGGLDSAKIQSGGSNVQVTGSYVNVSVNGSNVASFGASGLTTSAGTFTAITTTGDIVVGGTLTVNGTTTTVNSTTLDIADLNITVAKGAADSATADGAGLTVDGAAATILYTHATTSWDFNKDIITIGLTTPDITKNGVNGAGDIGQTGNRFATIYGLATSAQYADLAEKYVADADIEPGTVVHFGGEHEVSTCDVDHCQKVAGVVSTDPAYRMNDALEAEHVAMVALTGRVPCKVQGTVAKGDMMVSAGNGRARAEANPKVGAVIGKSIEASEGEAVIEVVVGKH